MVRERGKRSQSALRFMEQLKCRLSWTAKDPLSLSLSLLPNDLTVASSISTSNMSNRKEETTTTSNDDTTTLRRPGRRAGEKRDPGKLKQISYSLSLSPIFY